jgi:hypothetical protein
MQNPILLMDTRNIFILFLTFIWKLDLMIKERKNGFFYNNYIGARNGYEY